MLHISTKHMENASKTICIQFKHFSKDLLNTPKSDVLKKKRNFLTI